MHKLDDTSEEEGQPDWYDDYKENADVDTYGDLNLSAVMAQLTHERFELAAALLDFAVGARLSAPLNLGSATLICGRLRRGHSQPVAKLAEFRVESD